MQLGHKLTPPGTHAGRQLADEIFFKTLIFNLIDLLTFRRIFLLDFGNSVVIIIVLFHLISRN